MALSIITFAVGCVSEMDETFECVMEIDGSCTTDTWEVSFTRDDSQNITRTKIKRTDSGQNEQTFGH